MNSLTWTFLFGCTFLLFTVQAQKAKGIKCYVCLGTGCEDDFKSDNIMIKEDCQGSCTKARLGELYTRSCNSAKVEEECMEEDEAAVCNCNTDLCNGSTNVAASALVMGVLSIVAFIFKN